MLKFAPGKYSEYHRFFFFIYYSHFVQTNELQVDIMELVAIEAHQPLK